MEFFSKYCVSSSSLLIFLNSDFQPKKVHKQGGEIISRNNTIWYDFYKKFAKFTEIEKILGFFRKKPFIFPKDSNFKRFEKSHYFSRVLQFRFNLVKTNFHVQKRAHSGQNSLTWTQLANDGLKRKNALIWREDGNSISWNCGMCP